MIKLTNTELCATVGCERPARWIPIVEGNAGRTDRRCTECCDAISAYGLGPGYLVDVYQLTSWQDVPPMRRIDRDGVRMVLAGTAVLSAELWLGPVPVDA